MKSGKVHFAEHLVEGMSASLSNVRLAKNGLVDPTTVDPRVRALATAVTGMKDRQEWKELVSLPKIQELYFERVEATFGDLYASMYRPAKEKQPELSPGQFSGWFVSFDENVRQNRSYIGEFIEEIKEFWRNVLEPVWIHCEDLDSSKAIFGGALFPNARRNLASTAGLYVDTIILPCPFIKISRIFEHWDVKQQISEVIRYGLQVLEYKELALAEIEPPLVIILPDKHGLVADYEEFIAHCGRKDALSHAGAVFGRPFETMEEVMEYSKQFETPEELSQALAAPERLLFDAECTDEPLEEQIRNFLNEDAAVLGLDLSRLVYGQSFMRMNQANDVLSRSRDLRGTPIIDAETSWRYFSWKLEYDALPAIAEDPTPLHIMRGLQAATEGEMMWLGKVPPAALIEMRRQGAAGEIRSLLSQGITELVNASPDDFIKTSDKVVGNLRKAFRDHQENVKKLTKKKWSFAGRDISKWLVFGTLEVASAVSTYEAFGLPVLGLASWAGNQVTDVPKLKDIKEKAKALHEEGKALRRSPVGLLFKYKT